MTRVLLLCLLLPLPTKVWAAITFAGITGVTSYIAPGVGTATTSAALDQGIVAYGGTGGADCSGTQPNKTLTCNSCTTTPQTCNNGTVDKTPLCACNPARIYNNLLVTVNVLGATGLVHAAPPGVACPGAAYLETTGGTSTIGAVQFQWGSVCGVMGTGGVGGAGGFASCDGVTINSYATVTICTDNPGDGTFQITFHAVSADPAESVYGATQTTGIGNFQPFPGDGRMYIDNPQTSQTFAPSQGGTWTFANFYVSTAGLGNNNATPANNFKTQSLQVTTNGDTLAGNVVDGLTNGTLYYFRVAMVDQGGNILQFFPDTTNPMIGTVGGDANFYTDCVTNPTFACPFAATPDQVLGMLTKDFNCFIATAAYGSSMEPKLKTFRLFRRELLRHPWGKPLVLSYYKYGPYAARFIADKPFLRTIVRAGLWPLLGYSWLAIHQGLYKATVIALILLLTSAIATVYGIRRWKARA